MKVLCIGLNDRTLNNLETAGIVVVRASPEIQNADDLCFWLQEDESIAACVYTLENTQLGIMTMSMLRKEGVDTPIVGISENILRGYSWSETRAMFLEQGGDDLIHSPCSSREIVASLRMLSRRMSQFSSDLFEFVRGAHILQLNMAEKTTKVNGVNVHLTSKEFSTLGALATGHGRILTKQFMMEAIYSGEAGDYPESKIIDVFVCKLRKKFDAITGKENSFIETVWGRGYRLLNDKQNASITHISVAA